MARLEFETVEKLRAHIRTSDDLSGAVFQSLDLVGQAPLLRGTILKHNLLLGCRIDPETLDLFAAPIQFPVLPDLPFDAFQPRLYSPEKLLGGYRIEHGDSYHQTLDGKTYRHYLDTGGADTDDAAVTLARRLHDHGISDALHQYISNRKPVAIMGGHSMPRDRGRYLEVAKLSRALTNAGFLSISGGGPGAMEATHLGAWFADRSENELEDAVDILSAAPLCKPLDQWLDAAFRVVEKYPVHNRERCDSLGIPTWLYGHEPPSCFALHIAKYFGNAVREENLLAIATHGVIFSPGSAGTIQEIFQDACQNHYQSFGFASPMIFYGKEYWTKEKPVYPLLQTLSEGREYGTLLSISDSIDEIIESVTRFQLPAGSA